MLIKIWNSEGIG